MRHQSVLHDRGDVAGQRMRRSYCMRRSLESNTRCGPAATGWLERPRDLVALAAARQCAHRSQPLRPCDPGRRTSASESRRQAPVQVRMPLVLARASLATRSTPWLRLVRPVGPVIQPFIGDGVRSTPAGAAVRSGLHSRCGPGGQGRDLPLQHRNVGVGQLVADQGQFKGPAFRPPVCALDRCRHDIRIATAL